MNQYKESYKGLVGMILGFVVLMFLFPFLTDLQGKFTAVISMNLVNLWVALLALVIYKTECIYWYNGVSYEDAENAGSERRKAYAMQHLRRFGIYAGAFVLYSLVSCIVGFHIAIDFIIAGIGIVSVAVSTIRIKL